MTTYPNDVYGWNRYQGPDARPPQTDTGLPTLFAKANLPLQTPDESSEQSLDIPYSPVLVEMGVYPAGARPQQSVAQAPRVGTPLNQPDAPTLWHTVARAVFGGVMPVSTNNNTATLAAGGTLSNES